ncbi:hypothetical protein [Sinorhizobium meliloti]|uniref:hypothetical protein n=1 Tax=Rhizobium meliloti TaxID=382 RepID=UPI000FE03768|nr:hypothetical protein [Sinorhizobium meliloti]RVO67031.1 hypothetical protein CN094_01170 [Sinorhizobium meliloti]
MAIETSMASSPKHAEALGQIIASFGLLESGLLMLFGYILGVGQRRARVLYEGVSAFHAKIDVMEKLLPHAKEWIGSDEQKEIINILSEVKGINNERVKLVHSLWAAGPTKDILSMIPMTSRNNKSVEISVQDLEQLNLRILNTYSKIMPRYILPTT